MVDKLDDRALPGVSRVEEGHPSCLACAPASPGKQEDVEEEQT